MRTVIAVWLLSAVSFAASSCGVERQQIKSLGDHIEFSGKPVKTTVQDLRAFTRPTREMLAHANTFRFRLETIVYSVDAWDCGYKVEGDQDWHDVIASDQSCKTTMIIELVAPACGKEHAAVFTEARKEFSAIFPKKPTAKFYKLPKPVAVTVTGYFFFDIKHPAPQIGVGPNGGEIHPVLHIEKR